jgi:hypothetical protein
MFVVTVSGIAGTASGSLMLLSVTPVISSVTPTSGGAGTTVTLTGVNFSGATSVGLTSTTGGAWTCSAIVLLSSTQLTCAVAVGPNGGTLHTFFVVSRIGGQGPASTATFEYTAAPVLANDIIGTPAGNVPVSFVQYQTGSNAAISTACSTYDSSRDNVKFGVQIGSVIDYYRPLPSQTLCQLVNTATGGKYLFLENGVWVDKIATHASLLGGVVAPQDGSGREFAHFCR